MNAAVSISLTEQNGDTQLTYDADSQIGGTIAAVGQRLAGAAAKMIVNQGLKALEKQFETRRKKS